MVRRQNSAVSAVSFEFISMLNSYTFSVESFFRKVQFRLPTTMWKSVRGNNHTATPFSRIAQCFSPMCFSVLRYIALFSLLLMLTIPFAIVCVGDSSTTTDRIFW